MYLPQLGAQQRNCSLYVAHNITVRNMKDNMEIALPRTSYAIHHNISQYYCRLLFVAASLAAPIAVLHTCRARQIRINGTKPQIRLQNQNPNQ